MYQEISVTVWYQGVIRYHSVIVIAGRGPPWPKVAKQLLSGEGLLENDSLKLALSKMVLFLGAGQFCTKLLKCQYFYSLFSKMSLFCRKSQFCTEIE